MSKEPTIEQMNEAIALFEGRTFYGHTIDKFGGNTANALPEMQYHSSWDWLMPVIEKISKIPLLNWDNTTCTDPQDVCWPRTFGMPTEDGKNIMVRFNGFSLHTAPTLIESAHMAVYEIAEYHNKQQQNDLIGI